MGNLVSILNTVLTPSSPKSKLLYNLIAVWTLYRFLSQVYRQGIGRTLKQALGVVIAAARQVPGVGGLVNAELQKEIHSIEKELLGDGDADANFSLPATGVKASTLVAKAESALQQENAMTGQKWFGVYHELTPDNTLEKLQSKFWSMYNNSNALYPAVFPSVRKYEAEIVAFFVDLLHGGAPRQAVGLLTSGGTESILIACYTYCQMAKKRGICHPEIICCRTAHGALNKAAHYFNIKLVKLTADPQTQQMTAAAVKKHITANTIAVYASAPTFPHGVVDPIEEIAAVTKPRQLGLHVDNCLGGILLSMLQRARIFTKPFDFAVDGVTTISVDVHKYGYAPKGSSVVLFANRDLRALSVCPVTDGLTLYVTPTLQGSRSGGQIAAAWATLMHTGLDGYAAAAQRLHGYSQKVEVAVAEMGPDIRLTAKPDCSIVSITSDSLDIFVVASLMEKKGWNIFTSADPSSLAICFGEQHGHVLDQWINDLRDCVSFAKKNKNIKVEGGAAVYGAAKMLPDSVLEEVMRSYIDVKMTVKSKAA